jgi:hypothetical protein
MIRDNSTGVGVFTSQNHMIASLSAEHKTSTFQGGTNLSAGEIGREFAHVVRSGLSGIDLDKLLAGFGGNRITGGATIFHIEFNGLSDVVQRLFSRVTLANAPR